jgi:hypothetical protein
MITLVVPERQADPLLACQFECSSICIEQIAQFQIAMQNGMLMQKDKSAQEMLEQRFAGSFWKGTRVKFGVVGINDVG